MAETLGNAAVLFDLDGTLIDTAGDLAASMSYALEKEGIPAVPANEVRGLVGWGARRMLMRGYAYSTGREASEAELDTALAHFLEHYEANIAVLSRPYDGVIDLIDSLRQSGVRIAICTNKREALARLLIAALDIEARFDAIIGADSASAPKPDAAPLHMCLDQTGAHKGVMIGDSDTDIRAARAAKMPCLVATFGYGPLTLIDQAAAQFSDYRAVEDNIRSEIGVA